MKRWIAVCAWMVLPALLARAQTPDAEALERAQRDADNPLRLIIEAGKIKPRPKVEADAKTEPKSEPKAESRPTADKPGAHPVVAKLPAVEPVPRDLSPEATRAAALASVRALSPATAPEAAEEPLAPLRPSIASDVPAVIAPAVTRPDAPAVAQPAPVGVTQPAAPMAAEPQPVAMTQPVATEMTQPIARGVVGAAQPAELAVIQPATAPEPVAAPSEPVEPGAAPREPARVVMAVALPAPPPPLPPPALELLSSVQPELPQRILSRMRRDGEVLLVFKVNTDGTVSDLNVQSSNNAALDAIALDAVRQWHYKPIAQARTHRVQLVFKHE